MNEILAVTKTPLTSLLSALLIYIIYLQGKKQTYIGLWVKSIMSTRTVILLLVTMLIPFLLYSINMLALHVIINFIRELIVSIIILLPLITLWIILYSMVQNFLLSFELKKLSLIEELDLDGETWIALEQNRITYKEVERSKTLRSLRRLITQKNDIGWYELKAQIGEAKLEDPYACWIVAKELSNIQLKRERGVALERNHDYEKKLESLLSEEPAGVVWQGWDNKTTTEERAYEAQEMYAFKKWVWRHDETGWIELQYMAQNRETFSLMVINFAEFELQEIAKKKKKRLAFDPIKEKRLKSLIIA